MVKLFFIELFQKGNGYFLSNYIKKPNTKRIWSRKLSDGLVFGTQQDAVMYVESFLPDYEIIDNSYKAWLSREGKILIHCEIVRS